MCWSKNVSISMFILGTILNLFVYTQFPNVKEVTVLLAYAQYVLLMQLFDALLWLNQTCNKTNIFATNLQSLVIILQPVIFFLLAINILEVENKDKKISTIFIIFYLFYMFYAMTSKYRLKCSQSINGHLKYEWLNMTSVYRPGIIYSITIMMLIFLLIKPKSFSIIINTSILLTIIISKLFYPDIGIRAHMWCLYAVSLPIVVYLGWRYHKYLKFEEDKNNKNNEMYK